MIRMFGPVRLAFAVTLALASHAVAGEWIAPVSIAAGTAGHLWVAGENTRELIDFDSATGKIVRRFPLGFAPTGLLVKNDQVWVTGGIPSGILARVNPVTGKPDLTLAMPSGAMAPTELGPDRLAVLGRFAGTIAIVDRATGQTLRNIPVGREPVAAVWVAPHLWVAHLLPEQAANGPVVASRVSVVDPATGMVVRRITLPNGSIDIRDIAAIPAAGMVAMVHILARFDLPTTQVERGWMNTAAITLIRVGDGEPWATVLLDDPENGAANPHGVTLSVDGKNLFVSHGGTHDVSVIPVDAFLEKIQKDSDRGSLSTRLPFIYALRSRIPSGGQGPRAFAHDGRGTWVLNRFSDSLTCFPGDGMTPPETVPLNPGLVLTASQRGELAFHDATLCLQQWQSCSTCHPDGRADALNWDLLNDGLGNPKNVRSLLFAHKRSPVMSHGIRANAETAVRAGIKNILFTSQPEAVTEDLDVWLKSLLPVPSPHLENGKPSVLALKGKTVFEAAKCAGCHSGPYFTDTKVHDVGTKGPTDSDGSFLTPTLVELWRTAPYLHDGRAVTLDEALSGPGLHGGAMQKLSEPDREALIAFLKTL